MSVVLYTDMGPPYFVAARIEASAEFDPTLVTSTVLVCRKPSGAEVTWDTSVVTQDATQLYVKHSLVDGELDEVGFWTVNAQSEVPGGSRRTEVDGFFVDPPRKRRGS